jgi:hypothetical protein
LPDGEEIFYISNPALGLWALKSQFEDAVQPAPPGSRATKARIASKGTPPAPRPGRDGNVLASNARSGG